MNVDFKALAEPFDPGDLEWRIGQSGVGAKGPWAKVLAYITSRAVMQRLDEVCGPGNWRDEYTKGPDGGVVCGISIRIERPTDEHTRAEFQMLGDRLQVAASAAEWVTKWDGAENSQIESVKGGLSDAFKRAAVKWGIGRYLYRLEEGWAEIAADDDRDAYRGEAKDKSGNKTYFRWYPPRLPDFALPASYKNPPSQSRAAAGAKESPSAAATSPAKNGTVNQNNWSKDFTSLAAWVNTLVPSRFPNLNEAWSTVYVAAQKLGMGRSDVRECKDQQKIQAIKNAVAPEPVGAGATTDGDFPF